MILDSEFKLANRDEVKKFSSLLKDMGDFEELKNELEVDLAEIYAEYIKNLLKKNEEEKKERLEKIKDSGEKEKYEEICRESDQRIKKRYEDVLQGGFDSIYTNFTNNFYTTFPKKSWYREMSKMFTRRNKMYSYIDEKIDDMENELEREFLREIDPRNIEDDFRIKFRILSAKLFIEVVNDGIYSIDELIS